MWGEYRERLVLGRHSVTVMIGTCSLLAVTH
jgi:hypothetical protein